MQLLKKILKVGLYAILSLVVLLVGAYLILRIDTKPELIVLERKAMTDAQIDRRARELVDQMTLEEKVGMMSPVLSIPQFAAEFISDGLRYNQHAYQAGGNERLGIPTMRFFDGPRGMVSGEATCFPVAMARAAAFDRDLEYRIGEVIGKEIRANGGNYFGGVCINLLRHPAGGRAQETYGEDSYLLGQMGSALLRGVQGQNVMACVKHYALNNQENTRFEINVEADERTLREVYLPHFKECVDQGAASVMGAYNLFRGDQACESPYLLTTLLREEWGFKGFTISDFIWGIRHTERAANAGLDIEMPFVQDYGKHLLQAVEEGRVAESTVDESAFRITRTILKFELAPDPVAEYSAALIGSEDHIALALEAAERSMVLMQNTDGVLPFAADELQEVLVVGRLAQTENIGDHGSSRVIPEYVVTPWQGLEAQYGDRVSFTYTSGEDIEQTKALARQADAVVFIVGYDHDDEGEYIFQGGVEIGGDRTSLRLPAAESELLRAVGPENPNSVAVLIGGSAILVEEWKDRVNGILHAFYPGMEGGTAIAKTLFGAVNPGGKLPFTVAADESHYPAFDRLAKEVTYDRYHGYSKLDRDQHRAAFPFGFGLSYTTFEHDSAEVRLRDSLIEVSATVRNTGTRTGDQVLQLYIGFDQSAVEREHKLLKAFQRVTLAPGESRRVTLTCPLERIRWYNPDRGQWELERMTYEAYIGSSSAEEDLIRLSFQVE
jgi:beta-glucosidase